MAKHIHMFAFMIHSPINHTMLSWAHKDDNRLEAMSDIHLWQDYAQLLEKGMFYGLFFSVTPGVFDRLKDWMDEALSFGLLWPTHDPVVLHSALAAATKHLGLAATVSTGPHHPYQVVRQLSTLDYLTGGRIGWNIVTGHLRGEHRAFGLPEMGHDQRYDRAEEYMALCYALWDSIPDGAIVADRKAAVFADPAKINKVSHHGPTGVATAVVRIGGKPADVWSSLASRGVTSPEAELESWTKKRHEIVHQGKKPGVTRPQARKCLDLVSEVANAVDTIAVKALHGT